MESTIECHINYGMHGRGRSQFLGDVAKVLTGRSDFGELELLPLPDRGEEHVHARLDTAALEDINYRYLGGSNIGCTSYPYLEFGVHREPLSGHDVELQVHLECLLDTSFATLLIMFHGQAAITRDSHLSGQTDDGDNLGTELPAAGAIERTQLLITWDQTIREPI